MAGRQREKPEVIRGLGAKVVDIQTQGVQQEGERGEGRRPQPRFQVEEEEEGGGVYCIYTGPMSAFAFLDDGRPISSHDRHSTRRCQPGLARGAGARGDQGGGGGGDALRAQL